MHIIAQGAQYKVIDTSDGRVRKIPLSIQESQRVVAGWYASEKAPAEELLINYPGLAIEACGHVGSLLDKHAELGYSFGNPHFEDGGAYTQEKVRTLGDSLQESSIREGKRLIDGYIDLILLHWQYGFSEQVFNYTINNGIDKKGRVILLDFGELTFERRMVGSAIDSKRWLRATSYNRDTPDQLKDYYNKALATRLSRQTLTVTWGIAL